MAYDPYDEKEQIQIEILNNTINLDRPCYECVKSCAHRGYDDGPCVIYGFKKGYESGEHCDHCDNKRFLLTDVGQAIMNLMRRHAK